MPWQQYVADVAGEFDPVSGLPFYREVVVTVMRQQGKTTTELAVLTDRCMSWDDRQRVVYSAQTGKDARVKLLQDFVPVLTSSPLAGLIGNVRRRAGEEGINWRSGSILDVMQSTEASGHGMTLDLGFIDEAFDDTDDRREQAILGAMPTRADAQLWVVSTAGTSKSTYLRRKVETGRHAAQVDAGSGIAYFEWSIPADADMDDPETWWQYMPALGRTVTPEAVAHARQSMADADFRRAFGNQWTEAEHDRVIPADLWAMCCSMQAAPSGRITFGVDVLPDRSAAAIAAAGDGVVEVVDARPGTGWVVERCKELAGKWSGTFRVDGGGPAGSLTADLESAGLRVERLTPQESAEACARLYDAVADSAITVRTCPELDAAVAGLARRPVGDRFVWSRTTSTRDITPLYAATLAWRGNAKQTTPMVVWR